MTEYPFIAFYRNKRCEVYALTSFEAQAKAAKVFKARKQHEVTVVRADKEHSGASV